MRSSILNKYDLSLSTITFLALLAIFFGIFLFYPLIYIFKGAFWIDGRLSVKFFKIMASDPIQRLYLINSIKVSVATTVLTTLISLPLAYVMIRYRLKGKGILQGLVLVPMVIPPFVGAIGMKQLLARFGSVNLLLMKFGIPTVDWFGGGFWGVVILEALHLYPIMYLNVAAALANVDPSLEEAAENMGASKFRLFRTITFPLMTPGYFAGAIIVLIWAFTDLGTPLMFEYRNVIPVQIFYRVSDIYSNPMGYALVVLVIVITAIFFYISKILIGSRRYEMLGRGGHTVQRETEAGFIKSALIYAGIGAVVVVALMPHISVLLTSLTPSVGKWFMSILPQEVSALHYQQLFTHRLTSSSIRNSLLYSVFSSGVDLILGVLIAYLLARKRIPAKNLLDATAMLPLALPGIVLAFGYVGGFSGSFLRFLDPRGNPTLILIISYSVRRLPYMVRAAYAGFQQTSVTLEEASANLGASPLKTLYKITFPLLVANLVAGGILAFSFAMLEVSDSLILAMKEKYYPITKGIYVLSNRLEDGAFIASAMGVLGIFILAISLMLAGKFLGKRLGELFRA